MNPSPVLLKKMGLRFARSVLSTKDLDPEQKLWRAVVINAIEDCMIEHNERKPSLIKIQAHNWIILRKHDFNVVCGWGRLDPDDIEECYIKALRKLEMRFTHRQVEWFKYDKLYKMMLGAPVPDKKKLRKRLDKFRMHVKSTPITFLSTAFVSAFV